MSRTKSLFTTSALIALLLPAGNTGAQDFAEMIKDVSSISFYAGCWSARAAAERNRCWSKAIDYGVDISYQATKIPLPGSRNREIKGGWKPVRRETHDANGKTETTTIYEPEEDTTAMSSYLLLDVGLGYSEFSGFSSVDPSFELRGAVREIPAVNIYGTLSSDDSGSVLHKVRFRIGIRSGLIQLNDVQALDPREDGSVEVYAGTAQTFQLGGIAGLALAYKKEIYPYVEYAWMRRKFTSVQWAAQETPTAPARFPTSLDFSGPALTIGLRVQLK